jgi:hypothetical protein
MQKNSNMTRAQLKIISAEQASQLDSMVKELFSSTFSHSLLFQADAKAGESSKDLLALHQAMSPSIFGMQCIPKAAPDDVHIGFEVGGCSCLRLTISGNRSVAVVSYHDLQKFVASTSSKAATSAMCFNFLRTASTSQLLGLLEQHPGSIKWGTVTNTDMLFLPAGAVVCERPSAQVLGLRIVMVPLVSKDGITNMLQQLRAVQQDHIMFKKPNNLTNDLVTFVEKASSELLTASTIATQQVEVSGAPANCPHTCAWLNS